MVVYGTKDLPVCEDAISIEWIKNALLKYGFIAPDMTVIAIRACMRGARRIDGLVRGGRL